MTIQGRVADLSGKPFPGAEVTLGKVDDRGEVRRATTGTDGRYRFDDLDRGVYYVDAHAPGYFSEQHWLGGSFTGLPTHDGEGDIDLVMLPETTVAGRVLDESGRPLADVYVLLLREWQHIFETMLIPVSTRFQSDEQGKFRITGVNPGRYLLEATVQTYGKMMPGRLPRIELDRYPEVYYPGVWDVRQAEWITVGIGEHLSGYELQLRPARLLRLHGSVQWPPRCDPAFRNVHLDRQQIGLPGHIWCSAFHQDTFDFRGLRPGSYRLTAACRERSTILDLNLTEDTELVVRFPEVMTIHGVLRGLPDREVVGFALAGPVALQAQTRDGGAFTIENVVRGTYRLFVYSVPEGRTVSVRYGGEAMPIDAIRMDDPNLLEILVEG